MIGQLIGAFEAGRLAARHDRLPPGFAMSRCLRDAWRAGRALERAAMKRTRRLAQLELKLEPPPAQGTESDASCNADSVQDGLTAG